MIISNNNYRLPLFLSDKGAFWGWIGGRTDYRLPATDYPFTSCTTYFLSPFFHLPAVGGNPVNLVNYLSGFMDYAQQNK